MNATTEKDFATEIAFARRFAALSGPFNPQDALTASIPEGRRDEIAILVASHLAKACDTHAGLEGSQWLMRASERRWDIENLTNRNELADAIAWRTHQQPFDDTARDVIAALQGVDSFEPAALERMLAAGTMRGGSLSRSALERLAYALEWAGPTAPAYRHMERILAALNRLDDQTRSETILAHGFEGREEQRASLERWIAQAPITKPVRAFYVAGLPGIGKSALLEVVLRDATETQATPLVVRFDFDRPVLDVLDQVGLTLEMARQIASQLPQQAGYVRELRLTSLSSGRDNLKGRGRDTIPIELAEALGKIVKSSKRTVVMVLDTLEVLRGRGETHPRQLFNWLDRMLAFGLAPMAVIAGGRGNALDSVSDRIGERLDLAGLPPEAAERFLDRLGTPSNNRVEVHAFAKGNPLLLHLAGTLAKEPAVKAPRKRRKEFTDDKLAAAHLYRVLVSRIKDPDLRKLVDPGLLIRRINHEVIRDVLAPSLGLKRIGDRRSLLLKEELESYHWLVEPDPTSVGWLRQRAEMRALLLPLFYASKPARCAKIDREAAAWFEKRPESWLRVDGPYHRFQLMRRGESPPKINRDAALQFDAAMLSELPPQAKDIVLHARGDRSTAARTGTTTSAAESGGQVDPRAMKDLQLVIERGDWIEAADLYSRAFERASIETNSSAGDVQRTYLWRVGRWRLAKSRLQDRDATHPEDDDLLQLSAEDSIARLEMRAEFGFTILVRRLAQDEKFRAAVKRVVTRGAKVDMCAGALGLALRAAGTAIENSRHRADPVRAADELWAGGTGGNLGRAVAAAKQRMARRISRTATNLSLPRSADAADANSKVNAARFLAVLSPYVGPISTMGRLDRSNRLASNAQAVMNGLARSSFKWNGAISTKTRSDQDEAIDTLADLGLVAEWAGVAAFVFRDGDLAIVAKAAEAWRRTAAGNWAYGRAPDGWVGAAYANGLDTILWTRIHELLAAKDPVAAGHALLAAWTGTSGKLSDPIGARLASIVDRVKDRAKAATSRRRGKANRAIDLASTLLRMRAPTALIPPLATLVASGADLRLARSRRSVS